MSCKHVHRKLQKEVLRPSVIKCSDCQMELYSVDEPGLTSKPAIGVYGRHDISTELEETGRRIPSTSLPERLCEFLDTEKE